MQLSVQSTVSAGSANLRSKSRVKCCIPGCNNREGDPGFSFHRFPTDSAMRAKWVAAIDHRGFYPSQSTRICSRHFTRQCFVAKPEGVPRHPASRRRLYPNAVPSQFNSSPTATVTPKAPASGINLIWQSGAVQRPVTSALADPAPGPPSAGSCVRVGGSQEFALLSQIVRVALDLDEAQSGLLRELGSLAGRQRRQETSLARLLGRLARLADGCQSDTGDESEDPEVSAAAGGHELGTAADESEVEDEFSG